MRLTTIFTFQSISSSEDIARDFLATIGLLFG